MPNAKSLANLEKRKQFSSDYQPEGRGRPRNAFAHLKDQYELSSDDLSTVVSYMLSLPVHELGAIIKDPETPTLQSAIASAIMNGCKKGDLSAVNILLDRLLGKAKQTTDSTVTLQAPPGINITFTTPDVRDTNTDKPTDTAEI